MYQMYIVAPMVKAGMTYIGVGLIYKLHGLFVGVIKTCATSLRTLFDRCESEINVARSQASPLPPHANLDMCWLHHSMPRCDQQRGCWHSWCPFIPDSSIQNNDCFDSLLPWKWVESTYIHPSWLQTSQRQLIPLEDRVLLLLRQCVGVGPSDLWSHS